MNLPIGAVSILFLLLIRIPNAQLSRFAGSATLLEQVDRLDFPGTSLFAGSIIMLLLALNWGDVDYAWTSSVIIGLFVGATVTWIVFLGWEKYRGDNAMLPLRVLRDRVVVCSAGAAILSYGGLYTLIVYFPIWFQAVKGVTPNQSGINYLPSVVPIIFTTVITGILGKL